VTATDDEQQRASPGPFARHLGFRVIQADADGAVIEANAQPEHLNSTGIVHGGYLSSLLDSATGWAVHAVIPVGIPAPHIQISVQFIHAAVAGDTLVCRATCSTAGRRIASAQAEITQNDRVIARAVTSHAIIT
jgi:acyl-CoA thioesterase